METISRTLCSSESSDTRTTVEREPFVFNGPILGEGHVPEDPCCGVGTLHRGDSVPGGLFRTSMWPSPRPHRTDLSRAIGVCDCSEISAVLDPLRRSSPVSYDVNKRPTKGKVVHVAKQSFLAKIPNPRPGLFWQMVERIGRCSAFRIGWHGVAQSSQAENAIEEALYPPPLFIGFIAGCYPRIPSAHSPS